MIGLVLLILVAGLIAYIAYLVALRISKDATIASIVGLLVFLLLLFGGWGRVGGMPLFATDADALSEWLAVNWNSRRGG